MYSDERFEDNPNYDPMQVLEAQSSLDRLDLYLLSLSDRLRFYGENFTQENLTFLQEEVRRIRRILT